MQCLCSCRQSAHIGNTTTPIDYVEKFKKRIEKELLVNPEETSSARRKKESATDKRASSAVICIISIAVMGSIIVSMVVSDMVKLAADLRYGPYKFMQAKPYPEQSKPVSPDTYSTGVADDAL